MNYDNAKYKASISLDIKTYEIDAAGHVNNIVYIKWLEDLRCKLFENIIPIYELLYQNLYPVVTSTNIVYKKQLKINDKPIATIWIDDIQHNIMIMKVNFTIDENLYAIAEQKCVLLNLTENKIDKVQLKNL